ncbi:sigma-54 dependent transcriptional regulator [Candidatus Babeliales bacterium]|nr:sigma-54 dependent transcriptional regulator [Candidatus Babeliales bacterium]
MIYEKPFILIIDDETAILKTLKEALEDEDFRVQTLAEPRQALELIGQLVPDLILLDISMPHVNGIDLLENIKKEYPQQKIIMISGYGNIQLALEAIRKGAYDFIEKPLNLDEVLPKIEFLKTSSTAWPQQQITPNKFYEQQGIVGKSYFFQEFIDQIQRVAPLKLPLLIYGHHGTGKSMMARYTHTLSSIAQLPFHIFNCGSDDNAKNFDEFLAQTGTLFVKNIDMLSLPLQKNLAAHLENKSMENQRLIASANSSLISRVQNGTFNSLLFFKLNVTPLEIPALNKRPYDIPLLIEHFVEENKKRHHKTIVFPTTTVRLLRNHPWTGNVRELEQFIEKVTLLAPEDHYVVTQDKLEMYLQEKDISFVEEQSFTFFNSLNEATSMFEKKFLLYLLRKNKYDLDQVSSKLSINTSQLRSKMLDLNIDLKSS